ncbi:MAG: signal peptide peptidase SppA [Pseudobdellovibrionaceae bacterium]
MQNRFWKRALIVLAVIVGLGFVFRWFGGPFSSEKKVVAANTILQLDLEGVILNGKKFLKNLDKYKDNSRVKAILVKINSPGGAVGPSQEIYLELKRVREELKKPIVCVSSGMIASGAYYAAAACDKIVVAPGALVGSIGVIMEFANLEKLYDWAKVSRYSITSGKFKDSGAEYRSMRDDEKQLFQDLITEVYGQFKDTVMKSRNLSEEVMQNYADGRVFTGAQAVKLGFADKEGIFSDAVKLTAELANLGDNYEIFEVPKKKMSIFDFGESDVEDPINSVKTWTRQLLRAQYLNQPMYLMPGFYEKED